MSDEHKLQHYEAASENDPTFLRWSLGVYKRVNQEQATKLKRVTAERDALAARLARVEAVIRNWQQVVDQYSDEYGPDLERQFGTKHYIQIEERRWLILEMRAALGDHAPAWDARTANWTIGPSADPAPDGGNDDA